MNLASHFVHDLLDGFVLRLKTCAGLAVYFLTLAFTWYSVNMCIEFTYIGKNSDVLFIWAIVLLGLAGIWFYATGAMLHLWKAPARKGAMIYLLPLTFIATVTVSAFMFLAAAIAMFSKSEFGTNTTFATIIPIAGVCLYYFATQAVKMWHGERTWLV